MYLLATTASASAAVAQPVTSPQPASAGDADDSEMIIVTATRRDEAITAVPLAVTAISGQALELNAVRDTQDLTRLAPGLLITTSNSEATGSVIRMRGVGTSGGNLGLEGSVGVFVDGVYRARTGIALTELYDIQGVEVLRGPQGTLFGKNTTSGALVIHTNEPTFEWGGNAGIAYQNFNGIRMTGAISGPLVDDTLAFRVSAVYNKRDGYLTDVITGVDSQNRDRLALRGQLLFKPSDTVSVRTIFDYSQKSERCCSATYIVRGSRVPIVLALGGVIPPDPNNYLVSTTFAPVSNTREWGVSSQADINLGGTTWTTIASYREFKSFRQQDNDFVNVDLIRLAFEDTKDRFFTVESTWKGSIGRLDWLVGAFYFNQQTDQSSAVTFGASLAPFFQRVFPAQAALLGSLYPVGGGNTTRLLNQSAKGFSLFTHNIFEIAPGLKATAGMRWLREDKTGSGVFASTNAPACGLAGVPAGARVGCAQPNYVSTFEDSAFVGTAALSYAPTARSVIYVSYSRGYKAGGLNLDPAAGSIDNTGLTFLPETVGNWEAGAKGTFLDGRASLALTLFHARYTNFQQNAFNGTQSIISNAADVISKGVEIEAILRPSRWVRVSTSLLYNSAKYGAATAGLAGRQIVNAPEWTAQTQAMIEQPITDRLIGFINGNMRLISDVNTAANLAPQALQDGYALFGGRIGIRDAKRRWDLSLFAQNLSNVNYRQIIFATVLQPGSFSAFPGEPRSYGIELVARY
jgi:outer membrane receptor protein involved in Fe transport